MGREAGSTHGGQFAFALSLTVSGPADCAAVGCIATASSVETIVEEIDGVEPPSPGAGS